MSDGMGREFTYLSSHATNRYFIPNWGISVDFVLRAEWNVAFSTYGEHCPYQSLANCLYGMIYDINIKNVLQYKKVITLLAY